MARTVTFQGNPLSLGGKAVKVGDKAPDFVVVTQDLKEIRLADFSGKTKLISTFPSLDTPVCDLQVKEFNKRAASLSADISVIGISRDLPFAQKRFCSENGIKKEAVLSDYKTGSFGINYGLVINELNLLTRSIIIIDKDDVIRYIQIAPEITKALDYEDAIKALVAVGR